MLSIDKSNKWVLIAFCTKSETLSISYYYNTFLWEAYNVDFFIQFV